MTNTRTSFAVPAQGSRLSSPVTRRLLAVTSGRHEWMLKPDSVRGVYQVPDSQASADLESVATPQGAVPVVSLAQVLVDQLGMRIQGSESERTFVVVHHRDESVALRLAAVSRPIELATDQFYPLPALAQAGDSRGILDSLAIVLLESSDPSQGIRLVIDPLAAAGLSVEREPTTPAAGVALANTNNGQAVQPRGRGQLLAFSPLTAAENPLDFEFCLPLSAVAEVLTRQPVARLPLKDPVLHGFLMWHSKPVPVLDLGFALGYPACDLDPRSTGSRDGRILVVRGLDGHYIAIPVHMQIRNTTTPEAAAIRFPALDTFPHLGVFQTESGRLVVPDLQRILNSRAPASPAICL